MALDYRSESSDDDWLNKDEDELLEELKSKVIIKEEETELIKQPKKDNFQFNVTTNAITTNKQRGKLAIDKLQLFAKQDAIDLFLYINTTDEPLQTYFGNQLTVRDSKKRVLLYIQLLSTICELELPGFQNDVLQLFASNTILLHNIDYLAETLFNKRFQNNWLDEVDEFIKNVERLLLQAHQAHVLGDDGLKLTRDLLKHIVESDAPEMLRRPCCIEFKNQLNWIILNEEERKRSEKVDDKNEIFPTLNELIAEGTPTTPIQKFKNAAEYIQQQKAMMREDFMISLRACVHELRQNHNLENIPQQILWHDVQIVINKYLVDAKRHEMLFVDVLGDPRSNKKIKVDLSKIKIGALLCLTTSFELENLVLATVTSTNWNNRFIGIEIVRQYNIGNIYDKKMLMFETPAFFEPYHNVYNYLSNCNVQDFPMQDYIVNKETVTKTPAYMTADTVYHCGSRKWHPLTGNMQAVKKMPLDPSQLIAFNHALTNDLSVIQGPPGTGKTHLSVQVVKTLIENAKNMKKLPIVIITYTNESLDKFLLNLSAATDASILRFGSQSRIPEIKKFNAPLACDAGIVNPKLKRLHYVVNLELKNKFEQLHKLHQEFDGSEESYQTILAKQKDVHNVQRKLNIIRVMFQYYLAREKSVIAMTTTCAAKMNYLFRFLKSSIVIFEEAAEILESHVLACLTPYTEHVIMIGDHMQLQPYTNSYQYSRACDLNVSLFERLILKGLDHVVLKMQYRMRPVIADLLTPTIYDELQNADIVETYPMIRGMASNVYFVTHKNMEGQSKHECSKFNTEECAIIKNLAIYLVRKQSYEPSDIVVLSPYAKQIEVIQRELNKKELPIRAVTVDSFQGLEANIVLLSLVRNNDKNEIGFLRQKNRICVALSRAKHGLYVVGNIELLADNSKYWKTIAHKLNQIDAIGPHFPYKNESHTTDSDR